MIPVHWTRELSVVQLHETRVTYYSCILCGLVRKLPMPDKEEMRGYYQGSWQASGFEHTDSMRWLGDALAGTCTTLEKAMDVGSKGTEMFSNIPGIQVSSVAGLDPQPREDGITTGWLGDGARGKQDNDLVTCFHVLEHAFDLDAFLDDLES